MLFRSIVKHRSHNRKLFKTLTEKGGIRRRNQSARVVHGFRLFDKVICNGERGYIHGKRTSGYFHVKRFDGTNISKGISYRKLTFVECARNLDFFFAGDSPLRGVDACVNPPRDKPRGFRRKGFNNEWDTIFREAKNNTEIQTKYVTLLRSLFKTHVTDKMFALAYMTGILPIKKYGAESALTNFREYTMLSPEVFAEYTDFTEDEVRALGRSTVRRINYNVNTKKHECSIEKLPS